MSRLDWENLVRGLQRTKDSIHKTVVNSSMETFSETRCHWINIANDAESRFRSKGLRDLSPNVIKDPMHKAQDNSDGDTFKTNEDPELMRKRRELERLRELIMHKKAALGVKKLDLIAKEASPPDSHLPDPHKGAILKDTVNVILDQRHSVSALSAVSCRSNHQSPL